jgi:hypothetical protein
MANPRQEHTNPQETRRGSDVIGSAAQAAASTGEQAARASGNAGRAWVSGGERAAKAGTDVFESSAGAVEQLWRSGLDIASHFAEQSSSHIARSIGLSDENSKQATEQSSRNIDAVAQSTRACADGFQSISRELSGFFKDRMERNFEKVNALMRSRTPHELIAAQSDLIRDNMEGFLQSSRRLAEASAGVAEQAMRRLTESTERQR